MTAIDLSKRWIFYIFLLLFAIASIPHLQVAFYWDESWVYAPGVKLMYAHGPSLLPGAIPEAFSRGHPTFFHALYALWMDVFGPTNFSMHACSLFFSLLTAIAVYEVLRQLFNYKAALIGGILLLLNIHFYAQATMVLTDIMLGTAILLTVFFYVRQKYLWAILFLTITYYTKESGLVLCIILGFDILLRLFTSKVTAREFLLRSSVIIVPIVMIGAFFMLQKSVLGWYMNPSHIGMINFSPSLSLTTLRNSLGYLFYYEQIYYSYILFLIITIVASIRLKRYILLLFPVCGILLYLSIVVFSEMNSVYHVFIGLMIIISFIFLRGHLRSFNQSQQQFIRISFAFSVVFIYFCGINFYEMRYLFPSFLLCSVILLAVFMEQYLQRAVRLNFGYFLIFLITTGLGAYIPFSVELAQYARIDVQQQMVDYLEKNNCYDKHIYCPAFLEEVHLKDKNTGFLRGNKEFKNVAVVSDSKAELAVLDNIDCPYAAKDTVKNDTTYKLLQEFCKDKSWAAIYAKAKRQP